MRGLGRLGLYDISSCSSSPFQFSRLGVFIFMFYDIETIADEINNQVIPQNFHIHKISYASELTTQPAPTTSIVNGMSFILTPLPSLEVLAQANKNLHVNTYDPTPLDGGW